MSVLKTEDGRELILTCGWDDGIHFEIEEDFNDYMYKTYTNGNFYRDQDNGFFRTLGRKLRKIFAIIFNQDYYYAEVVFSKKRF